MAKRCKKQISVATYPVMPSTDLNVGNFNCLVAGVFS